MSLSIIVPVYNEKGNVMRVIGILKNLPIQDKEIIIVDDYSTDGTRDLLNKIRDPDIKVLYQPYNTGKGGAVRRGMTEARGDYVVIQDADLEYNPQDLCKLYDVIKKHDGVVVYGSRFKGKARFILRSLLANKFLTSFTNMLYSSKLTDMETCYKMLPRSLFQKIKLRANRFDMEPEITAKILRLGYKIKEVPISYLARSKTEGKKIGWKDGIMAIWTLIKYKF